MHTRLRCACHAFEVGHITPATEICHVSCRRQLVIVQLQRHTLVSKASCCSFLFHYQLRQPQLWPTADSWRTASSQRRSMSNQRGNIYHITGRTIVIDMYSTKDECVESRSQYGEESKTHLQTICGKQRWAEGSNSEELQDGTRRPSTSVTISTCKVNILNTA
jgi:hypothetical protein